MSDARVSIRIPQEFLERIQERLEYLGYATLNDFMLERLRQIDTGNAYLNGKLCQIGTDKPILSPTMRQPDTDMRQIDAEVHQPKHVLRQIDTPQEALEVVSAYKGMCKHGSMIGLCKHGCKQ